MSYIKPLVALIGFLDTKLEEHTLVYDRLTALGCDVKVIDISVRELDPASIQIPVAFSASAVREQASQKRSGSTPDGTPSSRADELDIMISGATSILRSLSELPDSSDSKSHRLCGVIGLGGSTTTAVVASIMRAGTTIGLPKLVVSTMASGDVSGYVEDSDITIMPSIVDISGRLNDISERMLRNASAAMAGMAHDYSAFRLSSRADTSKESSNQQQSLTQKEKRIAITMFGLTTPGVNAAMERLSTYKDETTRKEVYNPVVFHATGSGGRSMERLIREGWFDGVLDMTTTELADNLAGGTLSAGPTRLTAASSVGIPQIISLGALDMVNFGARDTIPSHYASATPERLFHEHNSSVTLMRTNKSECEKLGVEIAEKLRRAGTEMEKKTAVVIPLKGWSGIDVEGQKFHDKEADEALVKALREGLDGSAVQVVQVDGSINDEAVAAKMVELLHSML